MRILDVTRIVQLAGVDTNSATGAGVRLDFAESVILFPLFHSPVFQEYIHHFRGNVHVTGEGKQQEK